MIKIEQLITLKFLVKLEKKELKKGQSIVGRYSLHQE
jgi:hypothetical protein